MTNKTLVIGASENTSRYSNKAIKALQEQNHEVVALGKIKGNLDGVQILTEVSAQENIDTVTLYINPEIQKLYEDFLIDLKPRRVIFNPGSENPDLENKLKKANIETLNACTLVLLGTNQY
jgi:predicted CoA-binding protein